jgi:uncharacterized damage-inducible protein DinB
MPAAAKSAMFEPVTAMLNAFDTNQQMNETLLQDIAAEAWRADPPQPPSPPGKKARKQGRDIASIAAHMHNVRLMWLKVLKAPKLPEKLEPSKLTKDQAIKSLRESHVLLRAVLDNSMKSDGRIRNFPPDAARFFAYLVAHDAHHRGQISQLARFAGHPISQKTMFSLWEWNKKLS